jgi:isoleucyl-tRNA synthetase
MDYKSTLNLPQTDFPMKADLVAREPARLKKWETAGLYAAIQAQRAGAEKFVLHDGPPFANGDVHIGNALNKILKDIVVKYKTLRGFRAPYVPGWDCHGLPIEFKVTQDMRKAGGGDLPLLVVDDERNMRASLETLLMSKGYAVKAVGSAEEAMDLLAQEDFLMVIMDARLGGMSGYEFLGKSRTKWPDLPVLMITAYATPQLAVEAIKAGAIGYLPKPFAPEELLHAVARCAEQNATVRVRAIRKACEAYARKYIDIQRVQFKRLGVFGDWDNPYLTLAKEYEADELRLFADIVEQGFVYRGKKPVYWSIPCRTALAEAEVEYKDHLSQSVYVKFPLVGHPGTSVVIWTTTPWTLPANLAVAYNSTFSYSLVHVGNEDFIVSALLLPAVAEKCGWQDYQIVRSLDGGHLGQVEYQHPFCNRTGKFFPGDNFVDNVTGTGFVHIAPGHGLDDYHLGSEHGLPIYSPVDDDGKFTHTKDLPREQQMPVEMLGKSILEKHGKSEANEVVLHELRARKALLHQEDYHHSYPHCWRSKTPIIFRAMDQWFIEIDHAKFRERALEEINRVNWVPDWGKARIEAAVKGRPDWCISRQRTWGVPIPAFYDAQGNPILDARIVRNAAALVEKHGSNVWFEQSAAELWATLKPAGWTGPEPATKSNDTLDVWIDSGSSSRAVIARREELRGTGKPFQCEMYLEGSDQHRGWFQSSLLLSLAGNGAAPYKTVLTHGFMVDADREKISKSKQGQVGYEKPQTSDSYVKKYGADIVRLWVSSQDFRDDIIVSEERISKVAETYRVLRNALRYQLSNLYDFDPAKHAVPEEGMTVLDRWMLRQFNQLERRVLASYEAYEFHVVYQQVSQFAAVELSAIYHDSAKDCLYTHPANSSRRRAKQTVLYRVLKGMCQMLSPILSFTTDEAWDFLPGNKASSVHLSTWSEASARPVTEDESWSVALARGGVFEIRKLALAELETARQAKLIGKSLDAKVVVTLEDDELTRANVQLSKDDVQELLNVSQLEVEFASASEGASLPKVAVEHAEGKKCERCWHWETDVGYHPEHPTICARCVKAVQASGRA